MPNVKKYTLVFQNAIQAFLQYRLNLALYAVGHVVSLSAVYFLWLTVYEGGDRIGTYTFTGIVTYYILVVYLRMTINDSVGMAFQMVEDIKDGRVTPYLLKPQSYLLTQWFDVLGRTAVNHVFVVPGMIALVALADLWSVLPDAKNLMLFILFVAVALIFYYLMYALAALSSLWLERGSNFIYGTIIASNFLNGSLIPLDVFPNWFVTISNWLPFKHLMFNPIQAFLGRLEHWPQELMHAMWWMVILTALLYGTWRLGVRRFEAVGM